MSFPIFDEEGFPQYNPEDFEEQNLYQRLYDNPTDSRTGMKMYKFDEPHPIRPPDPNLEFDEEVQEESNSIPSYWNHLKRILPWIGPAGFLAAGGAGALSALSNNKRRKS